MAMFPRLAALLLCLQLSATVIDARLGCKDNSGADVDWWIIYKLPRVPNASGRNLQRGAAFVYQDVAASGRWTQTNKGIDDPSTALSLTMAPYYPLVASNDTTHYRLMYNDETPSGTVSEAHAHAKGVQLFDTWTGFWLIHSAPKFGDPAGFTYPSNAYYYGQSFLCVTMPTANLKAIGGQLQLYYPEIYSKWVPSSFEALYPSLWTAIVEHRQVQQPPYSHSVVLPSLGGVPFLNFGKSRDWGKDLYADLVTPWVEDSMYVEGWIDGAGDMPSRCNATYKTFNIKGLAIANLPFHTSKDHSKWTVSATEAKSYVCIGDINRQVRGMCRTQYGSTINSNGAAARSAFTIPTSGTRSSSPSPTTRNVRDALRYTV